MYLIVVVAAALIGVPIVFALAVGPLADFLITGKAAMIETLIQRSFAGVHTFVLLAVPLFILAGELMNRGGITSRIVRFAKALVGHFHGGLAQVNIVASILFAGLSGSAVAGTSSLGALLIPAMEEDGYPKDFSAAVTAASSIIGPIIPPSTVSRLSGPSVPTPAVLPNWPSVICLPRHGGYRRVMPRSNRERGSVNGVSSSGVVPSG